MRTPLHPTHVLCAGLFLSSVTIHVSAQGPTIGIKGGLNMSTLYNDEVSDDKSRIGLNAGVFARTTPSEPLGLQVEMLYSSKGNHSTYQGFFGLVDQTVDFNLNYLEVPVLLSFRFADQAVEVQAGAYAGYLLSANVSTEGDLGDGSDELDRDNFSSTDAGLVAGVAFNAGPAQIGARFLYGLTGIAKSDNAKFLLGDAKNACGQVYVAFGIPGGK